MSKKPIIHVFDVDGTLTHNDSLLLLLTFFTPSFIKRVCVWFTLIPVAVPAILLGETWKIKQALLGRLWKGWKQEKILADCTIFFNQIMKADIRKSALQHITALRQNDPDSKIVLLSASCTEWLKPLSDFIAADLICTELQYDDNYLFTGRFATANCKGNEKLKRLLAKYPAGNYSFVCYGNSKADKQLQSISKEFYYRYF